MTNKPSSSIKPTVDTRYHIDYAWWEKSGEDLYTYKLSHLPAEQRERLQNGEDARVIDAVDPETGEVRRLDALGVALHQAAQAEGFISPQVSMVDNIFRIFLTNGNRPLSPNELAPLIGKSATVILKTISGVRVYKGIRPSGEHE
jgi:hypothetical protein